MHSLHIQYLTLPPRGMTFNGKIIFSRSYEIYVFKKKQYPFVLGLGIVEFFVQDWTTRILARRRVYIVKSPTSRLVAGCVATCPGDLVDIRKSVD